MLSILHRGTGVMLAIGMLLVVYWLLAIATGPDAYATAQRIVTAWYVSEVSSPGRPESSLRRSSLRSTPNSDARLSHWLWIADVGLSTAAGVRMSSDHTYSPSTVLPDPGGATMCRRRSPRLSCSRMTAAARS